MVQYTKVTKRIAQHACVMGDPKTGKSTLVSKLAEDGYNLIWISADNGHSILDKLSPEAQARINLIAIQDTKDNPRALHTVTKLFDGGLRNICDTHGELDCRACKSVKAPFTSINLADTQPDTVVVLDSGSQVVESAINAISKREAKSADAVDGYKLDYGDWATLAAVISRILSNIQVAKYHVVVICHCVEAGMEDGSKKIVPYLGTLNYSSNAAKYFDHVAYCAVKLNRHAFGSKTTFALNVVTGSRTDVAIEDEKENSLLKFFGPPRKLEVGEVITTATAAADEVSAKAALDKISITKEDAANALGSSPESITPISTLKEEETPQEQTAGEVKTTALELLRKLNAKK